MKRLQNGTLQNFIDAFIKELKRENEDREYHSIKK